MKKLNLNQMENVQGGDFLDGACAVLAGVGGGMVVRAALGAAVAIPAWGQIALGVGTVACMGRAWRLW